MLRGIELGARVAREHMRAAESALQCHGSIELALSNLVKAGLIFAHCLSKLREATDSREGLLPGPRGSAWFDSRPFRGDLPKDILLFEKFETLPELFRDIS
jgi:hypothetical protein